MLESWGVVWLFLFRLSFQLCYHVVDPWVVSEKRTDGVNSWKPACRLRSVSSVAWFKDDLNNYNLSSCSSFGQSADKVVDIRGSSEVCLKIFIILGKYEKKKESSWNVAAEFLISFTLLQLAIITRFRQWLEQCVKYLALG